MTGGALYNLTGKGRSLAKLQDILGFGYTYNLNVKAYQSVAFTPEGNGLIPGQQKHEDEKDETYRLSFSR